MMEKKWRPIFPKVWLLEKQKTLNFNSKTQQTTGFRYGIKSFSDFEIITQGKK